MRFLTYNIRLGLESSLRRVGEVLAEGDADLIGLQEVGRDWIMGAPGDQLAVLGRMLGLPHRVYAPALRIHPRLHPWTTQNTGLPPRALRLLATPGPLVRPPGPRIAWYGLGLLSRWPVLEHTVIPLPREKDEQRVLLLARLATSRGPLLVGVTHLAVQQEERLEQARVLASLLRAQDDVPLVLLGDLNDAPGSPTLRRIVAGDLVQDSFLAAGQGGEGATFPARRPLVRLDYALFGRGLRPRSCLALQAIASDHLPVLAESE